MDVSEHIRMLSGKISGSPGDHTLFMERGKLYYRCGEFGNALNDFIKVQELAPGNVEAGQFIGMINGILEFRHTDIYNP